MNTEINFLYDYEVKKSKIEKYKRINLDNPKHADLFNRIKGLLFKMNETKDFIFIKRITENLQEHNELLIGLAHAYPNNKIYSLTDIKDYKTTVYHGYKIVK